MPGAKFLGSHTVHIDKDNERTPRQVIRSDVGCFVRRYKNLIQRTGTIGENGNEIPNPTFASATMGNSEKYHIHISIEDEPGTS